MRVALITLLAGSGLVLASTAAAASSTGSLRLPAPSLARSGPVPVVYKLKQGFTGRATYHLRWTDNLGRTVAERTASTDLLDEKRLTFPIDLSRAVAMKNHLRVDLSLDGRDIDDKPLSRHETADTDFIARPRRTGWHDYRVMMWQSYPADQWPMLKRLGVTGGQYSSRAGYRPSKLIDTDTRWYSGRLASKFYSPYHRWRRDRPINWSFTQAQKQYEQHPDSLAAFKRHPSLWDPYWRQRVRDTLTAAARRNAPYRPYFYALADEAGIAGLDAQWDFDFSDQSLVPMRRWLRTQYASLGALNKEWGTHFTDWHRVMPMTTNETMAESGNNFAAWADFKAWMDISFANALKMGADAVRKGDPGAYVGITGAQKPGWGGYDYARLTRAITMIEPYDIGRSVDIAHSLAPDMPIVTTSFSSGAKEKHRVWYELLHGNRGLIVWDAKHHFVNAAGKPGKRGTAAASYFHEIENGIGALIINSHTANPRIAIHYSQPSLRTQWLLERRPKGDQWMARSADFERTHNHFLRLRESWCDLIADLGLQADFVGYDQIPKGVLLERGYKVLVLPESSSLSGAEAKAIRAFVAGGGIAIASGMPGTYDEHSRKLAHSRLADVFAASNDGAVSVHPFGRGKAIRLNTDIADYLQDRLKGHAGPTHRLLENLLRRNGVRPRFAVENKAGHSVIGVERRVFADGGVRLISLQSNPQLRVSELGPPDDKTNQRFYQAKQIRLKLPRPMYIYDVRAHLPLGRHKTLTRKVDAYEPTILAVSDAPLAPLRVSIPRHAHRGQKIRVAVHVRGAQARTRVFHVEVRNPQGQLMRDYSDNIVTPHDGGTLLVPLAANDPTGRWQITVRDVLSGQVRVDYLSVD